MKVPKFHELKVPELASEKRPKKKSNWVYPLEYWHTYNRMPTIEEKEAAVKRRRK